MGNFSCIKSKQTFMIFLDQLHTDNLVSERRARQFSRLKCASMQLHCLLMRRVWKWWQRRWRKNIKSKAFGRHVGIYISISLLLFVACLTGHFGLFIQSMAMRKGQKFFFECWRRGFVAHSRCHCR